MYRTTTITYMQSDDQEEINEIYTSPTVVEQSVKTVVTRDEPTLNVSVSYSEADRSTGDEVMVERIMIEKGDEEEAGTVIETVTSETEPDGSGVELKQSLLDSSVVSEADRSMGEEMIETKTMIVLEESECDEERVVREMCKESFQQDASFEVAKQTESLELAPGAGESTIEPVLGSPLETESSSGQDYWQYHDTERHYIQNFAVQSYDKKQEDRLLESTVKECSQAKVVEEIAETDCKDTSIASNKSDKELAEIYRTLEQSYLSMWQLRDAENNYQKLDARAGTKQNLGEDLSVPTLTSDMPEETQGTGEPVSDERVEPSCSFTSQLEKKS
uniref:Uncharacterized protein n=1 Tax=Anopheles maculatus TaxID=74869 RepID=A0A182TCF3_9DIPT